MADADRPKRTRSDAVASWIPSEAIAARAGAGVLTSASTWQPLPAPAPTPERRSLIAEVAEIVSGLGGGRLRIAVDGLTASGKSTFGDELGAVVSGAGRQVLRASLDDFKRPWSEAHLYDRTSGEGYFRNAFDYERCQRLLLEPAGIDGSGDVALCSIDPLTQVDHSATKLTMTADAVLLVDGVFAFRPELDRYWDLRVWLDIDADLSVARGAQRDAMIEGSERAAEQLHRARYLPSERIYIAECDPIGRADVVIDNSVFERPILIRAPN